MNKKIVLCAIVVVFLLLAGCGPVIHITGQIVDQYGRGVGGIYVTASGTQTETSVSGYFDLTVPDVEYSKYITLTIDGTHLGFQEKQKSIQIYPDMDAPLGDITITRLRALVTGSVTNTYTTSDLSMLSNPALPPATIDGPAYPEGEVLVKFKDTAQLQSVDTAFTDLQVHILSSLPKSKILRVKTEGNIGETIEALRKRPDVEYAEPNYYVYPLGMAEPTGFTYCNDPYYEDQWNLQAINLENVWSYCTRGDSDIKVAVLDTGIKQGISDLDSQILWDLGRDIVDDDYDASVYWDSHGTYIASIIAAKPDNGKGIAGINYNIGIVPVRILRSSDDGGYWGTTEELLRGLEWAIYDADVDIINLSLAVNVTGYSNVQAVDDMINRAEEEGVLIVAAAGNDSEAYPLYPARNSKVLAVGAVGPTLQPASYSARNVDVYAPGGDYYTYPVVNSNGIRVLSSDGTAWVQGTSYASAHVAGVAALMLADKSYLDPSDLRYRIKSSSLDLAYDDSTGAGLLDAYRAVTNVDHGRIFVFFGTESADHFNYLTEESTYTYPKDGLNFFQLANVEAGYDRTLFAWVDRDASGTLSYNDLFTERVLDIDAGDEIEVNLTLQKYY